MLSAHVVVVHLAGFFFRFGQHVAGGSAERSFDVAAVGARAVIQNLFKLAEQSRGAHADLGGDFRHDAILLAHQANHDMQRLDAAVPVFVGKRLCLQERVLCFVGKTVQIHSQYSPGME